jgi:phage-related baseplate assembly protein
MPAHDVSRDVKYLNKDFASFRNSLIEFAQTYFPNTYNDFNESDPGMMFIEMASYVGDVLSYYIDEQFKESMLAFAEEKRTIYQIAQGYGYKPRQSSPASVTLNVFQTVPSDPNDEVNGKRQPNEDYCLTIPAGMQVTSDNGTLFRTVDDAIFSDSSSMSVRKEDIYEIDDESNITKWLLQKSVKAVSGTTATDYITFGVAEKYKRVVLENSPVLEILSVTDSDGNKWYEVPFLAQDTVYTDFQNTTNNSPDLVEGRNFAPFLLKLLKTSKRFKTFIRPDGKTEFRFGSGVAVGADEEIIPNPSNVGSNLPGTPSFLDTAFDPANFLNTETYGQCPTNTTLTVKYSYGGGIDDNVTAGSITSITLLTSQFDGSLTLDTNLKTQTKDSVAATNPDPATGGSGAETLEDVRGNALAYFQAQSRTVTKDDYITRVYSLPAKYGNVAKVYIIQDEQVAAAGQNESDPTFQPNPLALNMYILGYNQTKKLVRVNQAVKENIKTYLSQYRMMTDAVVLKDAWICNIGIDFAIFTKKGFNKNEVLLGCVATLKKYFHNDRWQINQPIVLADVVNEIIDVEGVRTVVKPQEGRDELIKITNKWGSPYSNNIYDIQGSTFNGVVYPPVDPTIFEVKSPDIDIRGRVLGDL